MLTLFLVIVLFAAFDIAALRWGCDSSDGMNSQEWERRQRWLGFH